MGSQRIGESKEAWLLREREYRAQPHVKARIKVYNVRKDVVARRLKYVRSDTGKRVARDRAMFKKFGISAGEFRIMLTAQGGVCAVCAKPESRVNRSLSIDHDHKTGRIRGLLCNECNTSIGKLGDTSEALYKAFEYLEGAGS